MQQCGRTRQTRYSSSPPTKKVSCPGCMACVDILCKVTCGDLVGVGDPEMTHNALRGSHLPRLAVNAIEAKGLHGVG